ncbi:hypothetical protein [Microbispora triticiradicis]|uniref:hypothetical protein n=1 Tax=Microbispora triticiradicis TaxID=2200763 RepID=UPI001AD63542|nr:hypothetical protein [Microbispora triticiradicis]
MIAGSSRGAEVALARPEHDGYDVHTHVADQTRGKHLVTDVAGGDLDQAVTRKLLRLGHGCLVAEGHADGPGPEWVPNSKARVGMVTTQPSAYSAASMSVPNRERLYLTS